MTSAIRARREAEDGFTLIELLVVVIIIGILAAIAIPAFLNQRENAYASAAESDARNAALAIESFFTSNDAYPTVTTLGTPEAFPVASAPTEVSSNVTLYYELETGSQTYVITSDHALLDTDNDNNPVGDVDACYDSDGGGILAPADFAGAGCAVP